MIPWYYIAGGFILLLGIGIFFLLASSRQYRRSKAVENYTEARDALSQIPGEGGEEEEEAPTENTSGSGSGLGDFTSIAVTLVVVAIGIGVALNVLDSVGTTLATANMTTPQLEVSEQIVSFVPVLGVIGIVFFIVSFIFRLCR